MKKRKYIFLTLGILVLLLGVCAFVWMNTGYKAMDEALTAIRSDEKVYVKAEAGKLVFTPMNRTADTGFIIYPGGRVDFRAYGPAAKAIAAEGYTVIIPHMPFNLAVFGKDKAADIMKAFPGIQSWYIGGHSLGGVMAARFVHDNPGAVKGIVFWASYPDKELSSQDIRALTMYGTSDGFIQKKKYDDTASLLPKGAQKLEIQGGNHSNFGWYGFQKGDNEASISREQQQEEIIHRTVEFLGGTDK